MGKERVALGKATPMPGHRYGGKEDYCFRKLDIKKMFQYVLNGWTPRMSKGKRAGHYGKMHH